MLLAKESLKNEQDLNLCRVPRKNTNMIVTLKKLFVVLNKHVVWFWKIIVSKFSCVRFCLIDRKRFFTIWKCCDFEEPLFSKNIIVWLKRVLPIWKVYFFTPLHTLCSHRHLIFFFSESLCFNNKFIKSEFWYKDFYWFFRICRDNYWIKFIKLFSKIKLR